MSTTAASRSYLRRCQNGIRTESRIQTSFFSISHLQTKPLLPSHCQVPKNQPHHSFYYWYYFFLHLRSNLFLVGFEFGRSPVEMSCCVETMLPYHTATSPHCLIQCSPFLAAAMVGRLKVNLLYLYMSWLIGCDLSFVGCLTFPFCV